MNNKLLLQDLTDQLADAGKIKKKDAEEFLRAFFKISEDALFVDGIIKINGLGTLKLVLVEARKSVNVSTGEEFEIREHYKVSFIPDAELKIAVNQPYAHLEPVELDGGNESRTLIVEKKTVSDKEKTKNIIETDDNTIPEKDLKKGSKKSKLSTIYWLLFFLVIALLGVWSLISNIKQKKEDAIKIRDTEISDSIQNKNSYKEDIAAIEREVKSDSLDRSTAEDSLDATIQSVAQERGIKEPEVAKPEKPMTAPATKPKGPPAKQEAPTIKAPVTKPLVVKAPVTKAPVTTAKKPAVTAEKPSIVPPATQEYIATVVLKKGNRLTLLALKYYGDKAFWVYIYQANKNVLKNPDNIPAGTTIRIPKPDPKLINAQNPALIAKAKALQLKILGQ